MIFIRVHQTKYSVTIFGCSFEFCPIFLTFFNLYPLQICRHRRWWTRMQRSAAHRSQIHWFSVCAVCFLGHGSGPFSIHKRANGFAETDSRPTNKPLLRHFLSICQITQRHWRHLFHGRTLHWDWELHNVRTKKNTVLKMRLFWGIFKHCEDRRLLTR